MTLAKSCIGCGRIITTGKYCTGCRPRQSSSTARGYGKRHEAYRRQWARVVAAGTATCARCGKSIRPGDDWHLDHADDRRTYLGPSHASCNMRHNGRLREHAARAGASTAGRFPGWPLPDPDPGNEAISWSRHWYGPANPRCPDCRNLGGPCPEAA